MKKIVSVFVLAALLVTAASAQSKIADEKPDGGAYTERVFPVVTKVAPDSKVTLRFYEDMPDVAYISAADFQAIVLPGSVMKVAHTGVGEYTLSNADATAVVNVGTDVFVSDQFEAFTNQMGLLQPGMANVYYDGLPYVRYKGLISSPEKATTQVDFGAFMTAPGVTEYYCRHDGETLRPGYILEDAYRGLIFEAKMLKNALVGTRTFRFTDHTTGSVKEHEVGHTMTQTYNEEFLSARSWFKFDGKNIWDVVHERGLRLSTDVRSEFPRVVYEASKDGQPFARIEACSKYVHEDEEAQHKILIPVGRYYYRVWTNTKDFETLFLAIFAVSETEQVMTE